MKCCDLHPLPLKTYCPRTAQPLPASCIHPFFQAYYIRPWKLRMCGQRPLLLNAAGLLRGVAMTLVTLPLTSCEWAQVGARPSHCAARPAPGNANPHSLKHSILTSTTELPASQLLRNNRSLNILHCPGNILNHFIIQY